MKKVCIVVPVYNCEAYLDRCVASVVGQTYQSVELILIDDGSTDRSGALCDRWAEKDARVRVIHQKNSGVSAARNAGLNAATGDFVGFVDADDWIEADMLQRLLEIAEQNQAELVLFDPVVHLENSDRTSVDSMPFYPESTAFDRADVTPDKLRYLAGAAWRILYNRQLLEKNSIRFDTTLPLSEDRLFNIAVLGCCGKAYYLREAYYHYWINGSGATGKYRPDLWKLFLNVQEKTEQALRKYWDAAFVPVYERVNLIDGAFACVYNIFSCKNASGWTEKYRQVREVVNDPRLQAAYATIQKPTPRQWLVKKKCCLMLCVLGKLWNVKNR